METIDTVKLLLSLIQYPYLFSYIEIDYCDSLEQRGLFDLGTFSVTAAGRDFVACNESCLVAT